MPRNKKIIVITGGAGFVGTNLIKLLLKKQRIKLLALMIIRQEKNQIILRIKM